MKKIVLPFQIAWKKICKFMIYGIKPVFSIFTHDVRTITKSISVIIIITGLCLLPSLYAWINIYACWDPYSKTGNMPIAIVNKDQGTVFNGKVINVGENIANQLKNNKSIGWSFVDEWQGNYGLNEGQYYALIEIPDNFSSRLVTLTTTHPQKPAIVYRVNEKLNSIATKIADAAKNKLVNTIKTNFVKTVVDETFHTLNKEMKNSNLKTSQIKEIKTTFVDANGEITKLKNHISHANSDSKSFQQYLNECIVTLPKVNEKITCLQNILDANKSLTQTTKQTVEAVFSDLHSDVGMLNELDSQNQKMISALGQINSNALDKDFIGTMEQISSLCSSIHVCLKSDIEQIQTLNKTFKLNSLGLLADSLNAVDKIIMSERTALDRQIPILRSDTSKNSIRSALTALSGLSSEITKKIQDLSDRIQLDGTPLLTNMVNSLSIELNDAGSIAELGRAMVPQLSALAVFGGASSKLSISQVNHLNDMLTQTQGDLNKLISKIEEIDTQNIEKLIDLAEKHPEEISDFISSPIDVKEIKIYNTDIFGVGLTPFYTVLAIWVGALLSCALLTVECADTINGVKLNLKQKHFGKMILFLVLSLIQSSIITLGDVLLLGVRPADFGLMMGVSALTAVTFTIIIYTLVSLFGNVGKAVAVVMMVFQIAGAGGIYPIQTNPRIFGILEPLWPFTYAINCYREAIAGPVWGDVQYNVCALLIFLGTFLFLAIFKKPFHKINTFMEHKYKEAKI